ncbi:unnamed protein product [Rotaria sp. Silwood1]|nr:unnamed protein product [Rotaria sp. Silwood1]CAF3798456.1 unnamed protein product [Rotaria sp. Silwood1]CAF3832704.1 unnamed protein product [Rotaria sp. Silwood1]CAF4854597.1 unnamed protein product [Rotaria sp. Silwood1]CAF4930347.1 unnamed protein product [Rotaria sp. Silwood1]
MLILVLFLTIWRVVNTNDDALYSFACSNSNQTCILYKIDIDLSSGHAISNEIANWHQSNIIDGFGSVAEFNNENTPYIILTTNCDSQANLINVNDLSQPPLSRTMKTSCTQPIHSLSDRYLLALGTVQNEVGGSFPVSLYVFDALSGQWNYEIVNFGSTFSGKYQVLHPQTGFSALDLNAAEPIFHVILYNLVNDTRHILSIRIESGQWTLKEIGNNLLSNFAYSTELNALISDCSMGGICVLNFENYQWELFLPISNFTDFLDWTYSIDKQRMYFITKQNVIVIDLSNKLSFHYRVLSLIERSGNIDAIDKTVVFNRN